MEPREIVEIVGEIVPAEQADPARRHGPQALSVAREMEAALASYLTGDAGYAAMWQKFRAAPRKMAPLLAGIVEIILNEKAALAQRLEELSAEYRRLTASPPSTQVDTGGGAYVGGSVRVQGGSFVGRDSVTITGDGNVVGDHSRATVVRPGADPAAIARAFRDLYAAVEQKPDLPPQDRADLQSELQELESEVVKGETADERFVARRLRNIQRMAPDILEVVTATLTNPLLGIGTVARKVAERMRQEAESA